jgi:hypothetical protein
MSSTNPLHSAASRIACSRRGHSQNSHVTSTRKPNNTGFVFLHFSFALLSSLSAWSALDAPSIHRNSRSHCSQHSFSISLSHFSITVQSCHLAVCLNMRFDRVEF